MERITSITSTYEIEEDRIRLAILLEDQRKVGLWLTQRLARRLVSALATHLEKAEAIPLPSVREAVMAHEQAQAVSTIKPATPVTVTVVPEAPTPMGLVTNITLNLGDERVELQFVSALDCKPGISLDRTLVRQWLSMLHRQFVKGEWPLDVWPAWLTEGSTAAGDAPVTRH